jgi:cardiolipin synthase A/B
VNHPITVRKRLRRHWKDLVIAILWLLLWNTNRRRSKTKFERSGGHASVDEMIPTLIGLTEGAIDQGNRVEILQNGAYFDRLLEDIADARSSIHIETFVWWNGDICDQVADALVQRAKEGVEVRLLIDYSGSSRAKKRHDLMKRLRGGGCEAHFFHPLRITNIGRMNNRTHRKIGVFDGRIAYLGGHGIAKEWTGNAEDREHWRDTFVRMEGPVATTVQGVFCENWIEETGGVPSGPKYFPDLQHVGDVDAHVAFASPRDSISTVQLLYYLAISAATKELLIQNPYFLPHDDAIEELKEAVKRGVDVRIMMPSADVIDSPIVQHASHHHFGTLLKNGVRIFEYRHTLLHQKVMIVDGKWSCVGSTNFDDRSFLLNDEVSVGFTHEGIARQLRDAWFDDLRHCTEVEFEEWRARPWSHKLLDGVGFLMRREF